MVDDNSQSFHCGGLLNSFRSTPTTPKSRTPRREQAAELRRCLSRAVTRDIVFAKPGSKLGNSRVSRVQPGIQPTGTDVRNRAVPQQPGVAASPTMGF